MIKMNGLTKYYRTDEVETTALNAINLHVQKGEFVMIKGPSGCGKSTLLNIIGLMDIHDKGDFNLFGEKITQLNELERTRLRRGKIGFIFQKFNLIDSLSVFENVELPLLYMKSNDKNHQERIHSVLDRLDIKHRAKHYPAQLSGGQQQRVAVARCVVSNPELILADEPTGNLDSKNGKEVMDILTQLNHEGKTIVMVSHNDEYISYAHRVINLYDGNIVE